MLSTSSLPDIPHAITAQEFRRRFRWLIFTTWSIPPVFGLGFILLIGVLTPIQIMGILLTPLEPTYILGWLGFAMWFLPRQMQPLNAWLDNQSGSFAAQALAAVRRFPIYFWLSFLSYLIVAPASVIYAAQIYTGFVATPIDWFRIELVALTVSIIVGLPIFFRIFDLFGLALGGMQLRRPIFTIRTKVFLIGALIPLLIDTMLVQYYWTRTGYFTLETFEVWLLLELLAIAGSLIFAHSFGQSVAPLQTMIGMPRALPMPVLTTLTARSTDELGVLTGDYRQLLEDLHLQSDILNLNNQLLRSAGGMASTTSVFSEIIELCRQAVTADHVFLITYDNDTNELVGVIDTEHAYRTEGIYRLSLEEVSLAVWIFKQGVSVAVDDLNTDPRVSPRMREQFDMRSAIGTPLRLEGDIIGVLMAVSRETKRVYSQRDVTMIEGLAREAAFALHVQRLRADQQHASAELLKLNVELERRVEERTTQLEAANKELEAFSYSVSHDLRAPLRAIDGFSLALLEDYTAMLEPAAREYLERVRHNTLRMGVLIEDLLELSRVGSAELNLSEVDISALANKIMRQLMDAAPERVITLEIIPSLLVRADARLIEIVLTNLLDNAWKYTSKTASPRIVIGQAQVDDHYAVFVRDNGAGFDMRYASKLFGAFQRLHGKEFPGTGIGLAIVARIIHRHGGEVWAKAEVGKGATFYFSLGNNAV